MMKNWLFSEGSVAIAEKETRTREQCSGDAKLIPSSAIMLNKNILKYMHVLFTLSENQYKHLNPVTVS